MMSRADNDRLCRIGPGTPMGAVFRRFWLPICTSDRVPLPGGAPRFERLLGENFVVFRNGEGQVGVLDELCPASWRVAQPGPRRGLRHPLHLSRLEDRQRRHAARGHEQPGRQAAAQLAWGVFSRRRGGRHRLDLPWPEGTSAAGAALRLHGLGRKSRGAAARRRQLQLGAGAGRRPRQLACRHPAFECRAAGLERPVRGEVGAFEDTGPVLEVEDTEFGYHYAAFRRGGPGQPSNVRIVPFIMPSGRIIPGGALQGAQNHTIAFEIPIDDEHTATYTVRYGSAPISRESRLRETGFDDPEVYSQEQQRLLLKSRQLQSPASRHHGSQLVRPERNCLRGRGDRDVDGADLGSHEGASHRLRPGGRTATPAPTRSWRGGSSAASRRSARMSTPA